MSLKLSLSDSDVRAIVRDAKATTEPDRLRSHLYRLINLRKEMATAIADISAGRSDMAAINQTAIKVLAEDRNTGILSLLDRKGLISSGREKLREQMTVNARLVDQMHSMRIAYASASNNGNEEVLRGTVKALEKDLTYYREALDNASRELEQAKSLQATAAIEAPEAINRSEDVSRLEAHVSDLQGQLRAANDLLAAQADQPLVAQAAPSPGAAASSSDMLMRMQEMFNEQVALVLRANEDLTTELARYKQEAAITAETIAALDAELGSSREDVKAMREAAANSATKIENLQATLAAQAGDLEILQTMLAESKDALRVSEDHASRLADDMVQAKIEIKAKTEALEAQGALVADLNSSNESLRGEVANANRSLQESQGKIQSLQSSIKSYSEQLGALDQRLQDTAAEWERRENTLNATVADRDAQLADASKALHGANFKINFLERNIETLNNRTVRLVGIKKDLEARLKSLHKDRAFQKEIAKQASYEAQVSRAEKTQLIEKTTQQDQDINALHHSLLTASKVIRLEGHGARTIASLPPVETQEQHVSRQEDTARPESGGPSN